MHTNRIVARTVTGFVAVAALGAGTAFAYAAPTRQVVAPDPVGDVQWDDDVNQRLVAATDVNKVVYRLNESALAVKIRVFHTKTLKDTERHHRAVTTFTHNDDHYRLTSTLDAAALYVLEDNAWTRVHHGTMSANGGDGQMMVKFPVSALGTAFVMQDLRTRLVVTGTSIVDRTATNKDLPVYPPR